MAVTITTKEDVYELLKDEGTNFQTKHSYSHPQKTEGKSKYASLGRILFNILLPEDYPFMNKTIDGKVIKVLLADIVEKYPPKIAGETASKLNKEGFTMGTINPVSFTPDSFIVPPHILKKKEKILTPDLEPGEFGKRLESLGEELVAHFEAIGDPAYDLVKSKAKAGRMNPMQMAVLLIAKGASVDIEGTPSVPITNSTSDGFDLDEFYTNAAEARAGLFMRSSGAALPGALARDVVYANANIKLEKGDCKTKRYFDLFVSPEMSEAIIGRMYLNEKTNELEEVIEDHHLLNKTIKLRSPLHCISKKGVCATCYGKLSSKLDTAHVGVLTGSIINELLLGGVAMKTRHEASNVKVAEVDFLKDMVKI
jgi:DNA-directed RNA polymerase subunit beta'